uniref:Uncharacterized protein n=1 Tax=Panagrolaimus superbus TaxID=310955 RepID=A0A914ZD66_9BILA
MKAFSLLLVCILPATVCSYAYLPNSRGSQSAAESVCRSLPYRTAYIGSKCFIALASDDSEDEYSDATKTCRNILKGDTDSHFKNYDFKPDLAEVKCDALLDEIKRSFILK